MKISSYLFFLLLPFQILLSLEPVWDDFLKLSYDEKTLLDLPSTFLSTGDLYLLDDPFIEKLFQEMLFLTENDHQLKPIEGFDYSSLQSSLTRLSEEGLLIMEGSDESCRPIMVTIQGVFEQALASFLQKGDLSDAKALFLTNTPCTPLMKEGNTGSLTNEVFEPARQYTLDKREYTLRQFMQQGGHVLTAYSSKKYQDLFSDPSKKEQIAIFEKGKNQKLFEDLPLYGIREIPGHLIGACYDITTKDGHSYLLITRGIQARESKPGHWEIWMANKNCILSVCQLKKIQMIHFILEQKNLSSFWKIL